MKKNVGSTERWIRAAIGFILLLFFLMDPPFKYVGFLAIVPFFTVISRYCPLNSLLGINNYKPKRESNKG